MRGRNLQPALTWVSANSERLARIGSNFKRQDAHAAAIHISPTSSKSTHSYGNSSKRIARS
ncbi:hypothetical protein RYX36_031653 [Vicia faba]